MSNSYWNFTTTLIPGSTARAEDVNSSFSGIQSGLDAVEAAITERGKVYAPAAQSCSGLTTASFLTIPSWSTDITMGISGISFSTATSTNILVQIGDSGGLETASYSNSLVWSAVGATPLGDEAMSTGYYVALNAADAGNVFRGEVRLKKITGNEWMATSLINNSNAAAAQTSFSLTASKTLSGVLDRIALTNTGLVQMDAGNIVVTARG